MQMTQHTVPHLQCKNGECWTFLQIHVSFEILMILKKSRIPISQATNTHMYMICLVHHTPLYDVEKFMYLKSAMTQKPTLEVEYSARLVKAASTFGRLPNIMRHNKHFSAKAKE